MFITTATAATVTELAICTRDGVMLVAGVSLVLVAFVVLVVALASLRPCRCYRKKSNFKAEISSGRHHLGLHSHSKNATIPVSDNVAYECVVYPS